MHIITLFEDFNLLKRQKNIINKFKKASSKLSFDEALIYILDNCKEWLENPIEISRGIGKMRDNIDNIFKSLPVKRLARDNANYYNLIMQNAPEWKDYPKRNNSFMCGRNVSLNNKEFLVIPKDGSKWAIAPKGDIFQSFKEGLDYVEFYLDIDTFFNKIESLLSYYKIETNDINYNKFKNNIRLLQTKIQNDEDKLPSYYANIITLAKKKYDLFDIILQVMDPVVNGFKTLSLPQISFNDSFNGEMWTDSECIFISKHLKYDLIEQLSKIKNENFVIL